MVKDKIRIKDLSVFQMFERNGFKYGFWLDSWKWANTCCRVLYFEYKGQKLPEHKPIWVWQKDWKQIVVQCEFWDIRHRSLIKTGPLPTPWMNDVYEMWKIKKD